METRKKSADRLILLLLIITLAALCVTVWALFFRHDGGVLVPDRTPHMEEPRAEAIPGDSVSGPEQPTGGSVTLSYAKNVSIDVEAAAAQLFLANPGSSNQDMILQLVVQETVLLQSGAITPGRQVTELALLDGAAERLSAGSYDGQFRIFFYDRETGQEAMVNTEIPVTITVS